MTCQYCKPAKPLKISFAKPDYVGIRKELGWMKNSMIDRKIARIQRDLFFALTMS